MLNVPALVKTPLVSAPLRVNEPLLVAVADAKLVAVAVAPVAMLRVPPLTALNDVVPAFNVNTPEFTLLITLEPNPEMANVAPASDPPKLKLPLTTTVPLVSPEVPVIEPLLKKFVVPTPFKLVAVTVPALAPKVNVAAFVIVPKLPLATLNNAVPLVKVRLLPPCSALFTVKLPLLSVNAPL
jgi:hypothetical protein